MARFSTPDSFEVNFITNRQHNGTGIGTNMSLPVGTHIHEVGTLICPFCLQSLFEVLCRRFGQTPVGFVTEGSTLINGTWIKNTQTVQHTQGKRPPQTVQPTWPGVLDDIEMVSLWYRIVACLPLPYRAGGCQAEVASVLPSAPVPCSIQSQGGCSVSEPPWFCMDWHSV